MRNVSGFTLVELMIVISIMGLLALIGADQFGNFKDNAKRAVCVSNQRNAVEQTVLYSSEARIANADINVHDLLVAGYLQEDGCECPDSKNLDYDDYTITVKDFRVTKVACSLRPAEHHYDIP